VKLRDVKLQLTAEQAPATFPPTSAQHVMPATLHAKKITNVKAISLVLKSSVKPQQIATLQNIVQPPLVNVKLRLAPLQPDVDQTLATSLLANAQHVT
jgi:hypothetical protein